MMTAYNRLSNLFLLFILSIVVLIYGSCSQPASFTQTNDGIIVRIKHSEDTLPIWVRLQAIDPRIIRVTASANEQFNAAPGLMIDKDFRQEVEWTAEKGEGEATLRTKELAATISLMTGEVLFKDKNGNVILKEKTGGGKEIVPIIIDEKPRYTIRQQFESPADEAFYGLGQPQTGRSTLKTRMLTLPSIILLWLFHFLYPAGITVYYGIIIP